MKTAASVGATAAGLLLVIALTLALFGLNVPSALATVAQGALGDKFGVARTLVRAAPLTLCGLGVVVAWRGGMYNIGGEGQYLVGGLAGAWCAKLAMSFLPAAAAQPLILGSAALGGSLYAGLAGWLAVKRGVQVVVSTILLNFIATQGLNFLVRGPLQESKHELPLTESLPDAMKLFRFDSQTDLHVGVFIALAAVAVVWLFLSVSKAGYLIRVVGDNPSVARATRIDVGRTRILAMLWSGGLCGLAGGVDYLGITGRIGDGFSQNWGFMAIPVALLGGLDPLGTALSALFFGMLFAGTEALARTSSVGTTVVLAIQATAVLGYLGITYLRRRREEGRAVTEAAA